MQRIHKKKETQFETIEFRGREGKVASLLCTQNMELSIIFLFDLLPVPGGFAPITVCPPRCREAKLASFFFNLETLPSHPPWPGCSSPGWQRCTCWWRWGSWWPGRSGGRRWPRWCCRSSLGNPSQDQLGEKIITQDVKSAKTRQNKRPSSVVSRLTSEHFRRNNPGTRLVVGYRKIQSISRFENISWLQNISRHPSLLTDCHSRRRCSNK